MHARIDESVWNVCEKRKTPNAKPDVSSKLRLIRKQPCTMYTVSTYVSRVCDIYCSTTYMCNLERGTLVYLCMCIQSFYLFDSVNG